MHFETELGPTRPEILQAIAQATGLTRAQTVTVRNFLERQLASEFSPATIYHTTERYAANLLAQRAQTIARTEATAYTNELVLQRGRDLGGVVTKQWVSARDGHVDEGQPFGICRQLDDGQVIPLEQRFTTADGLSFDGPPAHPNCRCVLEIQREE